MARFFVSEKEMEKDKIILCEEQGKHAKVLRLKEGEEVILSDTVGNEAVCVVDALQGENLYLSVKERRKSLTEPKVKVKVYMALPKADKFEHVVMKATELGASEIITFPTSRSIVKMDEKKLDGKLSRFRKIALSAAEQSGRGIVPEVRYINSYKEALLSAKESDKAILFYENEKSLTLKKTIENNDFKTVSIITGPEGGLDKREVEEAVSLGIEVCTLGSRILRCETAPLCALSAIMYQTGEF